MSLMPPTEFDRIYDYKRKQRWLIYYTRPFHVVELAEIDFLIDSLQRMRAKAVEGEEPGPAKSTQEGQS